MRLAEAWAVALGPALVALACFAGAWNGFGLCWDDLRAILRNRDVVGVLFQDEARMPLLDPALLGHDFWGDDMSSVMSHKSYRPLTVFTFRLDAARMRAQGGHTGAAAEVTSALAQALHRTNVLLHAACTALVGLLARELPLGISRPSRPAILFAVHGVHTEAVAGLVGRADVLAGVFFAGALLLFQRRRVALALVACALGTLCKESCITALGACAVLQIAFAPREGHVRTLAGLALCGMGLLRFRLTLHQGAPLYEWTPLENHISLEPSLWRRVCSYAHTHGRYAALLFWPHPLAFDHGFAGMPILDAPSALSLVMYCGLAALVSIAARRRDVPVLVCVALAGLPFVPASNVLFPIGTVLAERLLYVPSIGFCLLAALLLERLEAAATATAPPADGKPAFGSRDSGTRAVALCMLAVFAAALHTARNAEAWRNDAALYEHGVESEPHSLTALNNLGHQYMHREDNASLERATQLFERALDLYPEYGVAWHNLGITHRKRGDHSAAIHCLRKALALRKSDCNIAALLGDEIMRASEGSSNAVPLLEAQSLVQQAVAACNIPYAYETLATLDMRLHGPSEATVELYRQALAASERPGAQPSDVPRRDIVLNAIAVVYHDMGNMLDAAKAFEEAVSAGAGPEVLSNAASLGWLELHQLHGDNVRFTRPDGTSQSALERAEGLLQQALATSRAPLILTNLGWLRELQGRLAEAETIYAEAHAALPSQERIAANLARVRAKQQQQQQQQ